MNRLARSVVILMLIAAGCATKTRTEKQTPRVVPGQQTPQVLHKTVTRVADARYLLYLPEGYDKDKEEKWPLVIFLHGAGERGDDLEKLKLHGPPMLVAKGKQFPFVLVSPQYPGVGHDSWKNPYDDPVMWEWLLSHRKSTNK